MKLFGRLSCLAAAMVMAVSAVMPVSADEEKEFKYKENADMLVEESDAPTISFDTKDWENYVHLTSDASKLSIKTSIDSKTAYQGQSLIVTAGAKADVTDFYEFSWAVRDADNELMYPEAADIQKEEDETKTSSGKFRTCGIELEAEELGMNYFDGGMLTFSYRINPDADGLLMGNSCYVYCIGEDGLRVGKETQLKYNDTDSNNTTQWAKGVFSLGENLGATKLIIMVPLTKACDDFDVLYLDNLTYTTQTGKIVANLDNYNANAKPQATVQGLKIKKKENAAEFSTETKSVKSTVKVVIMYIGLGLLAIAIGVGIFFAVKKLRNRFY